MEIPMVNHLRNFQDEAVCGCIGAYFEGSFDYFVAFGAYDSFFANHHNLMLSARMKK
jgi:hypothetical protein